MTEYTEGYHPTYPTTYEEDVETREEAAPEPESNDVVKDLQRAVNLRGTGNWNDELDARLDAVLHGRGRTRLRQEAVGVPATGSWDREAIEAVVETIKAVQEAVGMTPTGNVSTQLISEVNKARGANDE